jgi:hypothetical protein
MLLALELLLTVAAWRRGWGARALIPLASCLAVSFLLGMAVAMTGGSPDRLLPLGLILDLGLLGVLASMAFRPRVAAPGLDSRPAPGLAPQPGPAPGPEVGRPGR